MTSQAPECVSSNVSRQKSKVEWELHFHLNSMLTDSTSLKITLWGLSCSIRTAKSKHTCLFVIHFYYQIINYVLNLVYIPKSQINLPQMPAFKMLLLCSKAFCCFSLAYGIKSTLANLASSPLPTSVPISPKLERELAAFGTNGSGFRRPQLTLQLHHFPAWVNYFFKASVSITLIGNNSYKRTRLMRLL